MCATEMLSSVVCQGQQIMGWDMWKDGGEMDVTGGQRGKGLWKTGLAEVGKARWAALNAICWQEEEVRVE